MGRIGDHAISGNPSPEEEAAIIAALERSIVAEKDLEKPSKWKMTARQAALRHGPMDPRFGEGSISTQDLRGRGDAK